MIKKIIPEASLSDKESFIDWVESHASDGSTYIFQTRLFGRKKRRWLNLKKIQRYCTLRRGSVGIRNPEITFNSKNVIQLRIVNKKENVERYNSIHNLIRRLSRLNGEFTLDGAKLNISLKIKLERNTNSRLYFTPVVTLKAIKRAEILINGEETVEVDYTSIHLRLLMSILGIKDFKDCYTCDGERSIDLPRSLIKQGINILFNAKNYYTGRFEILQLPEYIDWNPNVELRHDDRANHKYSIFYKMISFHPLSKCSYSHIGPELMFIDSELCIRVLSNFIKTAKAPILSIHDSFIVPKSKESALIQVMKMELQKILTEDFIVKSLIKSKIEMACYLENERQVNIFFRGMSDPKEGKSRSRELKRAA